MPNTPALVDEGMAAISPGSHCDEEHLAEAEALLRSCGKVVRVPENYQDAVTAISGSGPAYIFYVVEAMIEAGVLLGLPRATSTELVVQTLYGAATMLKETGEHPTVLREQVVQPGRHDDGRAAPARRPQGPRGVPDRHGGGAGPQPRAGVGADLTLRRSRREFRRDPPARAMPDVWEAGWHERRDRACPRGR